MTVLEKFPIQFFLRAVFAAAAVGAAPELASPAREREATTLGMATGERLNINMNANKEHLQSEVPSRKPSIWHWAFYSPPLERSSWNPKECKKKFVIHLGSKHQLLLATLALQAACCLVRHRWSWSCQVPILCELQKPPQRLRAQEIRNFEGKHCSIECVLQKARTMWSSGVVFVEDQWPTDLASVSVIVNTSLVSLQALQPQKRFHFHQVMKMDSVLPAYRQRRPLLLLQL